MVLLLIALPLLTLELSLGQKYQGGAADAFGALNPRFRYEYSLCQGPGVDLTGVIDAYH